MYFMCETSSGCQERTLVLNIKESSQRKQAVIVIVIIFDAALAMQKYVD